MKWENRNNKKETFDIVRPYSPILFRPLEPSGVPKDRILDLSLKKWKINFIQNSRLRLLLFQKSGWSTYCNKKTKIWFYCYVPMLRRKILSWGLRVDTYNYLRGYTCINLKSENNIFCVCIHRVLIMWHWISLMADDN